MLNNSESNSSLTGYEHDPCIPMRGGTFAKLWKLSLILTEKLSYNAGVSHDFHTMKAQFIEKKLLETQMRERPSPRGEPALPRWVSRLALGTCWCSLGWGRPWIDFGEQTPAYCALRKI